MWRLGRRVAHTRLRAPPPPATPYRTQCSSVTAVEGAVPPGVTAIRNRGDAIKAANALWAAAKTGRVFAVDTEVANIDLSTQGPVGNGDVICASVHGGGDVDFGSGPNLWVDNWGDAAGVLQEFKDVLQSHDVKKVGLFPLREKIGYVRC